MTRALLLIAAALMALLGTTTASATPTDHARPDAIIFSADGKTATPVDAGTVRSDFTTQALSCSSGYLCVWPVTDGSRSRCSWFNRDNDWWYTPVVCSWSSSTTVKAIYNHGTNSSYAGVCLYQGANYTDPVYWVGQGVDWVPPVYYVVRSHRWVPGFDC
ncbi:peptidase inhibitor family I36 protein [Saccharothrix variisporea]|uniref:Peptidase inhibitor family I36 n=1 Tax=Saccharothrix variisporea TaxID=543527 RepID=A0A495XKC6_9PSEU|nr:peptidase inhibitor family I36 protein [Saccharothrix variisporea]RKT75021.1 peptidase inhibitor family I36 [Saccharothrix variisporea]